MGAVWEWTWSKWVQVLWCERSELRRTDSIINTNNYKKVIITYLQRKSSGASSPPNRSPNFGGVWNAGDKSFKYFLKKMIGDFKLIFKVFLTIINHTKGILNNHTITPLLSDSKDPYVIFYMSLKIGWEIFFVCRHQRLHRGHKF